MLKFSRKVTRHFSFIFLSSVVEFKSGRLTVTVYSTSVIRYTLISSVHSTCSTEKKPKNVTQGNMKPRLLYKGRGIMIGQSISGVV